jgi:hypothetical protein
LLHNARRRLQLVARDPSFVQALAEEHEKYNHGAQLQERTDDRNLADPHFIPEGADKRRCGNNRTDTGTDIAYQRATAAARLVFNVGISIPQPAETTRDGRAERVA